MVNRRELIEHASRGVEAWEARWGCGPLEGLMKPEHEAWADLLYARLGELTQMSTATS